MLASFDSYLETLPHSADREQHGAHRVKDVVGRRGIGIGSAGLPSYNILLEGHSDALENDLVIYMKQAQTPAVSRHITDPAVRDYFRHEGHRTVISQRALQAHADPWLGWTELNGAGQLVAEVSPYAVDLDWSELSDPEEMSQVTADLARATATMHAAADEAESGHSLVPFSTERAIHEAISSDEEGFRALLVDFAHTYGPGPARPPDLRRPLPQRPHRRDVRLPGTSGNPWGRCGTPGARAGPAAAAGGSAGRPAGGPGRAGQPMRPWPVPALRRLPARSHGTLGPHGNSRSTDGAGGDLHRPLRRPVLRSPCTALRLPRSAAPLPARHGGGLRGGVRAGRPGARLRPDSGAAGPAGAGGRHRRLHTTGRHACYGQAGGPVTGPLRSVGVDLLCGGGSVGTPLARMTAHGGRAAAYPAGVHGVPGTALPWLLLAAHVAAGLLAALWLRRGEAAAARLLRAAATGAFRPLRIGSRSPRSVPSATPARCCRPGPPGPAPRRRCRAADPLRTPSRAAACPDRRGTGGLRQGFPRVRTSEKKTAMSKRNSQEAKRAARERLRIEREKQAKKERTRRQLLVALSVVGVLAVVAGIGIFVAKLNSQDASDDGMSVTTAGAKAEKTVDVYEDLRCPACASFEQAMGEPLQKGAEEGKYKLRVHLGAIIDGNMGGSGSRNAARALGAAKAVSVEAFADYKAKLYSAKWHPDEQEDKFADNDYLLKVSDTVPELKDNKAFEKAVKGKKYTKWAKDMIASFNGADVQSTPTVRIDGEQVQPQDVPAKLKELGVDLKSGKDEKK